MPSVAATAACCGLRPVAKALGDISGMTYTFGMGRPRPLREPLDDAEQRVLGADRLRPVHHQDDLVREPVRREVHHHGKAKGDDEAALPAEQLADHQQETAEQAEQQSGLDPVVHALFFPPQVP